MKKFTITCTEEQLRLIADAVEDWCRFLSGQCSLDHATEIVEPAQLMHELRTKLQFEAHPIITPDLPMNASYGWSGGSCPNEEQERRIAMSYGIYRQILHFFALRRKDIDWNTYTSPTLTCEKQGPLIKVEEIEVEDERQE